MLIARELEPKPGVCDDAWLNVANADEAAYVKMMGGYLLSRNPRDRYKYYCTRRRRSPSFAVRRTSCTRCSCTRPIMC
jgi:hypothetical protein